MENPRTFAERRRQLQDQVAKGAEAAAAQTGEVVDDWNNFPNYFKFSNFANASVPQPQDQAPPVDE
jgi:hypothetical protein